MTVSERLQKAASRVLGGDESVAAAQDLELVLLDEYLGDEQATDLQEGLALYRPGSGLPYFDAPELRRVLTETLAELNAGE
jgi:hypothetical protein